MAEARALHVVVAHLTDALGAQRHPAQILAAIPAAGRARQALALRVRVLLRLGPSAPRVAVERMLAQRRQLRHQLLAAFGRERPGDADVLERTVVVIEAEQERADHRARAVLVPAESGDDAIGGARMLGLDHRALAGPVGLVESFRHHAIEPGTLEALEPFLGQGAIERRRRQVHRRSGAGEDALELGASCRERLLAQIVVTEREQIPGDERRGRLLREQRHA